MAKGYGNLNFRNSYNTVASHEYENLSRLTKGDHLFCFCVVFVFVFLNTHSTPCCS